MTAGMTGFRRRTVNEIADMICGNDSYGDHFQYRSSTYLSEFFRDCGMPKYVHDGSTRKWWVADVLGEILKQPSDSSVLPGQDFQRVIEVLMDRADHTETDPERQQALVELNNTLAREELRAFYGEDRICYIRSTRTGEESRFGDIENRALSEEELERRRRVDLFIATASEDEFTERVVLPLLQTLRFQRVSVAGHKDKALEFRSAPFFQEHPRTGAFGDLDTGCYQHRDDVGPSDARRRRAGCTCSARSAGASLARYHSQYRMLRPMRPRSGVGFGASMTPDISRTGVRGGHRVRCTPRPT